jgi:glycosyltransferase involved in cell wall biosynthesis
LLAHAQGYPFIADLGDPVAAGYTPKRWWKRAFALEAAICAKADAVLVTSEATRALLQSRHACTTAPVVITQGFDAHRPAGAPPAPVDPDRFELLYTGSLYRFRRIDALLDALPQVPEARLSIASVTLPAGLQARFARLPTQSRALGFLPHEDALQMQRHADLLVNLANDDPAQIPGKFYEYLGAGRPILHIGRTDDAVAELLRRTGLGWSCENDPVAIADALRHALARRDAGADETRLQDIAPHSWQFLGGEVEAIARRVVSRRGHGPLS